MRNVPHNGVEDLGGGSQIFAYRVLNATAASFSLFLRTTRPTADTLALTREKLHGIDPGISLLGTGTLQQSIDGSYNQRRAVMLLLGTFVALALFLSALGIYGVLAYDVSQRTREIGVRGAIGATGPQIIWLIMRQGLLKTALGLVIGLVAAIDLSSLMKSLLFDVSPTDPSAYIAVCLVLFLVAAAASYFPARSAARINPIEALRAE